VITSSHDSQPRRRRPLPSGISSSRNVVNAGSSPLRSMHLRMTGRGTERLGTPFWREVHSGPRQSLGFLPSLDLTCPLRRPTTQIAGSSFDGRVEGHWGHSAKAVTDDLPVCKVRGPQIKIR
jgi:hypothetical protein